MSSKSEISTGLPLRRGLAEPEAALYISVSASTFRKMVEGGLMPKPRELWGRRVAWDIDELDAHFKALPRAGEDEAAVSDSMADWK
jgi:predicted DNA-binding transcriptional regulator AlpA